MGIEFCNRMGKSNSIWPSHIFEKQQQNSRRYRSEPLTVQDPGKEHGYRPLCFQAQNGKTDHHTLFKILEICARTEADQFIILDEKNVSRPKLNKKLTCYKLLSPWERKHWQKVLEKPEQPSLVLQGEGAVSRLVEVCGIDDPQVFFPVLCFCDVNATSSPKSPQQWPSVRSHNRQNP